MRKLLRWISIGVLLAGAVLLFASFRLLSPNRWSPVSGPVPGTGLSVKSLFTAEFKGNYALEVCKPITEQKNALPLPPMPPLFCHLRLTIANDSGWQVSQDIQSLRHTSRYVFGNTDYYEAEPLTIPQRGRYVIELACVDAGALSASGAAFSLARNENAADAMVFGSLGRIVGGLALAGGIAGMLCCRLAFRRTTDISQPEFRPS